jgi:hypothetical protein
MQVSRHIYFCKCHFPFFQLHFHFHESIFGIRKVSISMKYHSPMFFFFFCCSYFSVSYSWHHCLPHCHENLPFSALILSITFRPMIKFGSLFCVWCEVGSNPTFNRCCDIIHWKACSFHIELSWHSCWKFTHTWYIVNMNSLLNNRFIFCLSIQIGNVLLLTGRFMC